MTLTWSRRAGSASPVDAEVYTDGACNPNPGPGGWGAVVVVNGRPVELSGYAAESTNNRMELTAAFQALRSLDRPMVVRVTTDSQYLKRGIEEWLPTWESNDWRRPNGRPVANADLWQALRKETLRHTVMWHWVRGHEGHPGNERADALARRARDKRGAERTQAGISVNSRARYATYISGCAQGARGPAGYGVVIMDGDGKTRELSGGEAVATANQMELRATIAALDAVPGDAELVVFSRSRYLVEGASTWLPGWQRSRWRTQRGEIVQNKDEWETLALRLDKRAARFELAVADDAPLMARAAQIARREAGLYARAHSDSCRR